MASQPWLIIGLGNPGAEYENNRHNVGRMVVSALADEAGAQFSSHRSGAYVAQARIGVGEGGRPGPVAILAYLTSYMNVSGQPTRALMSFYKTTPERLIVVHDELDLAEHTLRLKVGGGEGGHNGLRSISQALGTRDYARLRVGIGRPPGRQDPVSFVLSNFPRSSRADWEVTIQKAADALTEIVTTSFSYAQQRLHTAQ
ncbi:MAG: aminoacyl-tRNA hydrolase [Actinomycetaceae bacterium]|nr:aminoacyl-tRNA hydrolase [Actinomycetaceae bacterium]